MNFSVRVTAFEVVRLQTRYIRVRTDAKRRSSRMASIMLLPSSLPPLSSPPETKIVISGPHMSFLLMGLGLLKAVRSVES